MLLLYIFALVMIFSAVPVLISMTKKASAAAAMKRIIEKRGGKIIPVNPFWYVGSINGKNCDFHVVFDKRLISVKVVSFITANTLVDFIDETTYGIKTLRTEKGVNKDKVTYNKCKKKPYNFKYRIPEEYSKLPKARVILINEPYPARVTVSENGFYKDVHQGEALPEGELYKVNGFINLFK